MLDPQTANQLPAPSLSDRTIAIASKGQCTAHAVLGHRTACGCRPSPVSS